MKILIILLVMILTGCAAIETPIHPRVYDPVTMAPGEYPY